ncbi:uncharacterized protein B0H18DRAFT_971358 [Fomitopsis serialis]|uniref:uncharacterized protein n=1 Tax=Fomitopsis serialis TaxID=139415 RepID=UPI0020074FF3|nr:uncharacterized protein B0H18DRAFT_971358 [Neoantrodia serialis]KAH9937590.1 hypothetical protein B0H18DRAFT_971358 [Neoantrodia serialis]
MRDRSLNTTSMNFGEKGSKKGGRTRADVLQDLSIWAQEHNGDTLTFACWQAMDLTIDIHKADTHFLALTLRKNDVWTNRRAMYKLVDAQVLPLTLLSKKFEHAADALDEQPVDVVQQVLGTDKRRRIADGALGSVLVMSHDCEEAVLKKVTPTFQPLGLFKEHYEYLRRLPPVVGSFWKPCLRNALDGGAYSIKFEPWPAT